MHLDNVDFHSYINLYVCQVNDANHELISLLSFFGIEKINITRLKFLLSK